MSFKKRVYQSYSRNYIYSYIDKTLSLSNKFPGHEKSISIHKIYWITYKDRIGALAPTNIFLNVNAFYGLDIFLAAAGNLIKEKCKLYTYIPVH